MAPPTCLSEASPCCRVGRDGAAIKIGRHPHRMKRFRELLLPCCRKPGGGARPTSAFGQVNVAPRVYGLGDDLWDSPARQDAHRGWATGVVLSFSRTRMSASSS